jgi:hypothetical protein
MTLLEGSAQHNIPHLNTAPFYLARYIDFAGDTALLKKPKTIPQLTQTMTLRTTQLYR